MRKNVFYGKVSKLEGNLRLLELKTTHAMSDEGALKTGYVLEKLLPNSNELPEITYQTKQITCLIGLQTQISMLI